MMQPLTSKLPTWQRETLHADFLANEQDYLRMRDGLLATHRGQWVAVHQGHVIAASHDLMAVVTAISGRAGYPHVALVGNEEVPFRVRRAEFAYDLPRAKIALARGVGLQAGRGGRTLVRS